MCAGEISITRERLLTDPHRTREPGLPVGLALLGTSSACSALPPRVNHTDLRSSACWKACPPACRLLADDVNVELARRQQGYGRGRRMQIERDEVEFLSGVRAGQTIGSPIAMLHPESRLEELAGRDGSGAARGELTASEPPAAPPRSRLDGAR